MIEDTKRETIVFAYDTDDERKQLMAMFPDWFMRDTGLRIVAMSHDNEIKRVNLIEELVLEGKHNAYDLADGVETITQHPNLSRFAWSDLDGDCQ